MQVCFVYNVYIMCYSLRFCKRFPNVATAVTDDHICFPDFRLTASRSLTTERSICLLSSPRHLHASGKNHSSHAIRGDVYHEDKNMIAFYLSVLRNNLAQLHVNGI